MKRIFKILKYIRKEDIVLLAGLLAVCILYSTAGIGCPVKWLTGISCAGCGMTRAILCAVRLQFDRAFYYHPLFVLMPACAAAWLFRERIPKRVKEYMAWSVIVCFLVVYIWRLFCMDCPVVSCDVENGLIARLWSGFKN